MTIEWSGFALGLLFGAAKVMTIGAVGFGIAWWRARRRIQELESERFELPGQADRLEAMDRRLEQISLQLEELTRAQGRLLAPLASPDRSADRQ